MTGKTLVGVLVGLLLLPVIAEACSCSTVGPACQAFWKTDAVFVGTVAQISETEILTDDNRPRRYRIVEFWVRQAFRGSAGAQVEVLTGLGGGDCGYSFEVGKDYLVYAHRNKSGKLYTGICSRTGLVSEQQQDLDYLEGLSAAPPGGMVFGLVRRTDPNSSLEGIEVSAEGESGGHRTVTAEDGRYEFSNLAAGKYRITALMPSHLMPGSREVEVVDRGCAQVDFYTRVDGRVIGRVLDAEGKPAARVRVTLLPVGVDLEANHHAKRDFWPKQDGAFSFITVPPGQYLLGVNIAEPPVVEAPYPPVYYPGVSRAAEAVPIELTEGEKLGDLEFRLPYPLRERTLEIRVFWPDGRPARASVRFYYPGYPWILRFLYYGTDESGVLEYKTVEGVNVLVEATANGQERSWCSPPQSVEATDMAPSLRLILSSPGRQCLEKHLGRSDLIRPH